MTLTTRTLSNAGDPLYSPGGTLLAGVAVTFTLVSSAGRPVDAWDATTHERIAGEVSATTDAAGEFSVDLWPNSRGTSSTKYLCEVDYAGVRPFTASVEAGETTLTWVQFMAAGAALSDQELTALALHVADTEAAHAASAISVSAIAGVAATTVQAALANLASRVAALEP